MSPEANLLRLAYIDMNALLVEGFDTNAEDLVKKYRANENDYQESLFYAVAKTLTEIRDLFGADDI
jgi:hypothetical protein